MELFTRNINTPWHRIVNLLVNNQDDLVTTINNKDTCKLILIQDGIGLASTNSKSFVISAPMLIFLSHNDSFNIVENNNIQNYVLYFRPDVINDSFTYSNIESDYFKTMNGMTIYQDYMLLKNFYNKDKNDSNYLAPLSPTNLVSVNNIINNIRHELVNQEDGFWPCRSRSYFLELLFLTNSFTSRKNIKPKPEMIRTDDTNIQQIICYLTENISKKLTIEDLSKKFTTNRNKLNEEFKKNTGLTCMKYLNKIRMNLSCLLLHGTELPIIEISDRVGFTDVNYFIKAFKSYYNITPAKFRSNK